MSSELAYVHFPLRAGKGLVASCIAAVALSIASLPSADAATLSTKKFVYRASDKKLSEVLQDFAASQDLPLIVDPGVAGTVTADFNAKPEDFLGAMARTYGVIWYFDGTTLFIYPSNLMQSRVFRMRGYDRQQVKQLLASLGLGDARYPLRFDDANQTLLAYGPPRHIELVSTLVEQLERDGADRIGRSIRVFPLRYASAADRTFGSTSAPGLARTLSDLFAPPGEKQSGSATEAAVNNIVGQPDRVRAAAAGNFGLKLPPVTAGPASAAAPAPAPTISSAPAGPIDLERPQFQAEESTNSIIVRGLPDRMKEYEALIQQLDVAQDLVEIEATIIDVSADEFDSLGVDFDLTTRHVQARVSPGTPGGAGAAAGSAAGGAAGGSNISTVIRNAGTQLISRIRALEGNGKARILARPKVLGVANRVARMADKRVVSVRVAGNLDANLFSIETGTSLQVTPQILTMADQRKVRMSLAIRDGSFEAAAVDSVPVIKQTEIETEATINEGESLLIGGISIETDSNGVSGVPGLSRIPVLGSVFRHREKSNTRSERLFLITPKIISSKTRGPVAAALERAATPASTPAPSAVEAPVTTPVPPRAAELPASGPQRFCAAQALGLPGDCASAGD